MDDSSKKAPPQDSPTNDEVRQLVRLPKEGKVAGVCAGLANYLALDVSLIRVIFVVLAFVTNGFAVIVYIALAVLMPVSNDALTTPPPSGDISQNFNALASEIRQTKNMSQIRNYAGVAFILFGAWLLLSQLFPYFLNLDWDLVWPVLLIGLGAVIIMRRSSS